VNTREHIMIGSISATAAMLAAQSLNLAIIDDQEMIIGVTIAGLSSLALKIGETQPLRSKITNPVNWPARTWP